MKGKVNLMIHLWLRRNKKSCRKNNPNLERRKRPVWVMMAIWHSRCLGHWAWAIAIVSVKIKSRKNSTGRPCVIRMHWLIHWMPAVMWNWVADGISIIHRVMTLHRRRWLWQPWTSRVTCIALPWVVVWCSVRSLRIISVSGQFRECWVMPWSGISEAIRVVQLLGIKIKERRP